MTGLKPTGTTRIRESGVFYPPWLEITETWIPPSAPSVVTLSKGVRGVGRNHSVMTDVVIPDFAKRRAAGEVFFNRMEQVTQWTSGTSAGGLVAKAIPTYDKWSCSGPWGGFLLWSASGIRKNVDADYDIFPILNGLSSSQMRRAETEAASKAAVLPSDSQLLVTLAEFMQVVRLFPDIVRGFAELLAKINTAYAKSARRSVWRNLKDELDFLQNLWLASRFGLRPLIADSAGMLQALSKLSAGSLQRVTQRGHVSVDGSSSSTGTLNYGVTSTPVTEMTTDQYSVRAMTLWEAHITILDDLGVNLANVPLAVVDLTRFSFVLNWIVNVNEFASAVGALIQPGWSRLGGCVVGRRETATIYQTIGSTTVAPDFSSIYTPERDFELNLVAGKRAVTRVPGAPKASFSLRADPFRWTTDWRLLDAAALLGQNVRGRGVQRMLRLLG